MAWNSMRTSRAPTWRREKAGGDRDGLAGGVAVLGFDGFRPWMLAFPATQFSQPFPAVFPQNRCAPRFSLRICFLSPDYGMYSVLENNHGLRNCRTLHWNERYCLCGCLSRRLHPSQERRTELRRGG